jgi:tetratricopeptide (TPR) repeat protein
MAALAEERLADAVALLGTEPPDSPCYALARGNLGLAHLRRGEFSEAERATEDALREIDLRGCPHPPSHIQFLRQRGEAAARRGRWEEGLRGLERALDRADELVPACPELRDALEIQKADTLNAAGNVLLDLRHWKGAAKCFTDARDIYDRYRHDAEWPLAYALTNLGLVWNVLDEKYRAQSALLEAKGIVEKLGDADQLHRINIGLIQLGSSAIPTNDYLPLARAAAEAARASGNFPLALRRYCILAEVAERAGALDEGFESLSLARGLLSEVRYDQFTEPRLVNIEAGLLERAGSPREEIIRRLTAGASLWYSRIAGLLPPADFKAVSSSLHDHFRRLARHLLTAGDVERALLAFEAGRTLGHGVDVDPSFVERVIGRNPFAADGSEIDLALLREAQATIPEGQVVIVVAALPPALVGFVVGRDAVTAVSRDLPVAADSTEELTNNIKRIPERLQEGEGRAAIPDLLHDFAAVLAGAVSGCIVCGFMPYAYFHLVPWRVLLHDQGISWEAMPFSVGFGLLLRDGTPTLGPVDSLDVIALGHGSSRSGIDFTEEARVFADHFGTRARFVPACTAADLNAALGRPVIALLSSHGEARDSEEGVTLALLLSDGHGDGEWVLAPRVFPQPVTAPLVILSACYSGAYQMAWGDYPVGGAPLLIHRGAALCICTRYAVSSEFTLRFFDDLGRRLKNGDEPVTAFIRSIAAMPTDQKTLWQDLACIEILGRT